MIKSRSGLRGKKRSKNMSTIDGVKEKEDPNRRRSSVGKQRAGNKAGLR